MLTNSSKKSKRFFFWFLISAQHNNTVVNVKTKKANNTEVHRLNASQHKQINVSREEYFSVDADKPVSVVQYLVTHVVQGECVAGGDGGGGAGVLGGACGSSSSSSLLFVPPMEQREHQYLFSSGGASGGTAGKQKVNLVIATPLREGVILNGMDLFRYIHNTSNPIYSNSPPTWIDIDGNINNSHNSNVSNYSAIQFLVEEGLHKLTHNSTKAEFSATLNNHHPSAIIPQQSATASSFVTSTTDKSVGYIQDKMFSGNGAIPPPTAKVEKSNTKDEINNAYLAKSSQTVEKEKEPISHSVIAMIVTLCTAVLLVIICIVGFVFAEFAFHNGEKSLFKGARVAPYEPIELN